MYDYLRKRAQALADGLRAALLGAAPLAGAAVPSDAELNAARWRLVLSVAEAALATGMSESAIKVGVHRGLKALAALMKETR